MIDQTTAELINTDIDGRLPAAQRAELSRILLADPEARALHRDLQRLQRELAAVTAEPAPAGLADSIMAAIPAVASGGGRPGAARPWRSAVALAVVLRRRRRAARRGPEGGTGWRGGSRHHGARRWCVGSRHPRSPGNQWIGAAEQWVRVPAGRD